MKAALIREIGGLPELAETDAPSATPVGRSFEIHAVPLNPIDVALASGKHYLGPSEDAVRPWLGGSWARSSRPSRSSPGTRVYISDDGLGGRGRDGTLGELATVAEEEALPLPDGVSDELATACGTAGACRLAARGVARGDRAR